ncbi:MAG: FAD-binding oxidoreductase [Pseudomonadota bacterium]
MTIFAANHAEPGRPFWWDQAEPGTDAADASDSDDRPDLPSRCDVLIVGSGFTGLSAALVCADGAANTVVVDAGVPGIGASSRNGGMFGAHPRLPFETLVKSFGDEAARGVIKESTKAFDFTHSLIEREQIQCDLQMTGRIQLAWTHNDFDAQKKLAEVLSLNDGPNAKLVSKKDLEAEIRTRHYFGGLLFPEHAGLHPAKFHAGLLRAVRNRNVPVIGHCKVESVSRQGGHFRSKTSLGEIVADKVLIATNGYTVGDFGHLKRRVFPLPSFIAATEPLDRELLQRLAPGGRMMVETRARHSYFRLSPDGTRILYGGRSSMVPTPPHQSGAALHAMMCDVWPELQDVKVTHAWTGNTGYTFNHTPHVGEWNGLNYSMGYSGSGVAMAPYLGAKAGYQMLGDARGETAFSKTHLATSWLHPTSKPYFLYSANLWYRTVVDRLQTRQADRDRRGLKAEHTNT